MTTFDTTLLNLVKSVYSIEEFSERIVRGAVTETILRLSEKFGLNSTALLADFVEPLVAKYAHTTKRCPTCKAITSRGKKCTKDALSGGYCQLHLRQQVPLKKRPRHDGDSGGRGEETVAKITRLLTMVKQKTEEGQLL